MILLYSPCFRPSPNLARTSASQGARARGDRGSILGASVVNGKPFRPMVTEAAALLPLNVHGDGCPEPATPAFRIASRSDATGVVTVARNREKGFTNAAPLLTGRTPNTAGQMNTSEKRTQVHRDGGDLVVVAGTIPNLHEAAAVTRRLRQDSRLALIPPSMSTSMEMFPMSNVISLAQRMAARVDVRAEAYKQRALADNFMDETETETYRDWKSTAREFEQYADLLDSLESVRHSGFTPRNIRRLRDYVSLDDSIA